MAISNRMGLGLRRAAAGAGLLALAMATTACSAASGTFNRTLQVSGPVVLTVHTASGYIHVLPGGSGSVHILGHVHSGGPFNAQSRVRAIQDHPPIEQSGNVITLGRNMRRNHVSISYDITVPRGTQLKADSASGSIRVDNLDGPLTANTASGSIQASGLNGHVALHSVSGSIHASIDHSPDVTAHAVSGSIHLENVRGMLYAKTVSGSVEVSGHPEQGWHVETVSGSVTLRTGGAGYALEASSVSGDLHSSQPLTSTGSIGRRHIQGKIHGGGPTVRVNTVSGDIRIR